VLSLIFVDSPHFAPPSYLFLLVFLYLINLNLKMANTRNRNANNNNIKINKARNQPSLLIIEKVLAMQAQMLRYISV
jgi:hypothetical protein